MQQEVAWLLQEKYQGQETADFFADCARLDAGEPLAYIIGHIPFLDCNIYLDSRPLIPRTETEFWAGVCIRHIKARRDASEEVAINLLDLCAGSGCIGVALGKALPSSHVDFAEIEPAHGATIRKNCLENLILEERFTITTGDLFSGLRPGKRYHYIVSNPPYIDPLLDRTEISVKTFEPAVALYGGSAGVGLITNILAQAPDYLAKNGELWLEHEPEQVAAITALGARHFTILHQKDQYGVERFTQLVLQ